MRFSASAIQFFRTRVTQASPRLTKVLYKYKLKPDNLENLLFLTLNKHKTIDYQSLAYELIKTWKYEVENKAKNWKASSS